jgi:uncharacterized protein YjiS (DUF1127 family)
MNKPSSGSVNSVVRLHFAEAQPGMRLDLRERRPNGDRTRPRRPDAVNPESITEAVRAERHETSIVWAVIDYLMESFALAGASLYPTAHFPVEAYAAETEAAKQKAPARTALPEHASPAIAPPNHWSWPTSSWQVFDTLWAHWRGERQIRTAIDALAELDDRTLRDMGIPHRSQIEYTIRYCRSC